MSVYARFAAHEARYRTHGSSYPMSPEMRAANADGRLFSSPEVFAARAFNDFPRDKHIAPQHGWGAECADLIAPLEHSAEAWQTIREFVAGLPAIVPHINSGPPHLAVAPASVTAFYANDIELWEKVSRDFDPKNIPARRQDMEGQARRQAEVVRLDAQPLVHDRAVEPVQHERDRTAYVLA